VLVRAGHTEAGCDLAQLAGLLPAAVICEILKDDGTMARLPDLVIYAREHGLKIGTIADLIHYRSQHESLVRRVTEREIQTAHGKFRMYAFLEKITGLVHLAFSYGEILRDKETLVRVHQPLSLIDFVDLDPSGHSWAVSEAMARIAEEGSGVLVFLNCPTSASQLIEDVAAPMRRDPQMRMDFLTYGIGAQILRDLNVGRMKLLGTPRKIPSMTGFDLEVTGFLPRATSAKDKA